MNDMRLLCLPDAHCQSRCWKMCGQP